MTRAAAGDHATGDDAIDPDGWARIPITTWAIAGVLSFGQPMTGYDIKKWADSILALFYWSPAVSQIYAELRRLEALGLAASHVAEGDERARRIYAITPKGIEAVRWWLANSPVEPPVLKHTVALRVWLGALAEPERLESILEEHQARSRSLAARAARSARSAKANPDYGFPAAVAQWAHAHHRAEEAQAERLLREVKRLAASRRRDADGG